MLGSRNKRWSPLNSNTYIYIYIDPRKRVSMVNGEDFSAQALKSTKFKSNIINPNVGFHPTPCSMEIIRPTRY